MSVTRAQLYREVWAEPMTKVAARYQVSSSFLARVCQGLRVPRPGRGYWAKLAFGKKDPVPALPEPQPGDALEWSRGADVPVRRHRPLPTAPERRPQARRVRVDDPTHHSLMDELPSYFEKVYPGSSFTGATFLRPHKRLIPDIYVTKTSLERALDVANALFLTLERHGYRVMLAPSDQAYRRPDLDYREEPTGQWVDYHKWQPARPTVTFIGTVAIGLTLYELTEHVDVRHVNGQYVRVDEAPRTRRWQSEWIHKEHMPTGRLALRAYSPYSGTSWQETWREKAAGDLVNRFASIVRAMAAAAPPIAANVAEVRRKADEEHQRWLVQYEARQREERARKEKEEREERERRRKAAHETSHDELLAAIEHWGWARRVDEFFAEIDRKMKSDAPADQAVLRERVTLARAMVGEVNLLERLRAWRSPAEIYPQTDDPT